jgi:hypothetical protein
MRSPRQFFILILGLFYSNLLLAQDIKEAPIGKILPAISNELGQSPILMRGHYILDHGRGNKTVRNCYFRAFSNWDTHILADLVFHDGFKKSEVNGFHYPTNRDYYSFLATEDESGQPGYEVSFSRFTIKIKDLEGRRDGEILIRFSSESFVAENVESITFDRGLLSPAMTCEF